MKIRTLFLIFLILAIPLSAAAVDVHNLTMGQHEGRAWLRFDLSGEPGEREADVTVTLLRNGKRYEAGRLSLTGALGKKIQIGPGKLVTWDVLRDFPGGFDEDITWEVSALESNSHSDSFTGMTFKFVKGGCFQMGDLFGDGQDREKPPHEVCLDDYWMGKFEVTQGEYRKVMGVNPSNFKQCGDNCPVESVSWDNAQDFIKNLNSLTGKSFRLPTEAEWEYAARSGRKKEKYIGGDDPDSLAWYDKNSGKTTHPVGQKAPNGLGLYDMSGNVWEWVQDWYDEGYYKKGPKKSGWKNPQGPSTGDYRVLRGGSWLNVADNLRASYRYSLSLPVFRIDIYGFRLVISSQGF
jgi:formylglycine-generating enzyme required for sulfatase activity